MKNTSSKIEEIVKEISTTIDKKIEALLKGSDDIILGYDTPSITAQLHILNENLDRFNAITENYFHIFEGKPKTKEAIEEMLNLPFANATELSNTLKEKYLDYILYDYKLFKFKLASVVKMYDYPDHVDTALENILSQSAHLTEPTELIRYFDESKGMFIVTEKDEQEIIDQKTIYATEEIIFDILNTAAFVKVIKNLKQIYPNYYLSELPEIPFTVCDKLIRKPDDIYSDLLEINLDYWKKTGIKESALYDIEVIGTDENGCPLLRIDKKYYRFANAKVTSFFKAGTVTEFIGLGEVANREQLIRVVIHDLTNKLGCLVKYEPLQA